MKSYNRFMERVWLLVTIAIFVMVTFMGFKEGFETWWFYYFLGVLTLGSYLLRRWMFKRMLKHQQWLEEQAKKK